MMLYPLNNSNLTLYILSFIPIFENSLIGIIFNDNDTVKSQSVQFIADRGEKFNKRGIIKFQERLQTVFEQCGK